jgi:hypothetical protein
VNSTTIRLLATYVILVMATGGMLALLLLGVGDQTQVWTTLGLIVGALIRDAASVQSAAGAEKIADAAILQETIRQDRGA